MQSQHEAKIEDAVLGQSFGIISNNVVKHEMFVSFWITLIPCHHEQMLQLHSAALADGVKASVLTCSHPLILCEWQCWCLSCTHPSDQFLLHQIQDHHELRLEDLSKDHPHLPRSLEFLVPHPLLELVVLQQSAQNWTARRN